MQAPNPDPDSNPDLAKRPIMQQQSDPTGLEPSDQQGGDCELAVVREEVVVKQGQGMQGVKEEEGIKQEAEGVKK